MNRVNIIKDNIDLEPIKVAWAPIFESKKYSHLDTLCEFAHYESIRLNIERVYSDSTESILPYALQILSNVDELNGIRVILIDSPVFQVSIDNKLYAEQVNSYELIAEMPLGFNIFKDMDKIKDDLISNLSNELSSIIRNKIIDGIDSMVLHKIGPMMSISERTFEPKLIIKVDMFIFSDKNYKK